MSETLDAAPDSAAAQAPAAKAKVKRPPGRPATAEDRERLVVGIDVLKKLEARADALELRLGFRPTLPQVIAILLVDTAKQYTPEAQQGDH